MRDDDVDRTADDTCERDDPGTGGAHGSAGRDGVVDAEVAGAVAGGGRLERSHDRSVDGWPPRWRRVGGRGGRGRDDAYDQQDANETPERHRPSPRRATTTSGKREGKPSVREGRARVAPAPKAPMSGK
jgi:hypothetical protein